ncbi:MAG: hypothetical protein M3460_09555 [Actinomycetota bacterium]|nr:hypothetical protein [Actinomycetota bacterium]
MRDILVGCGLFQSGYSLVGGIKYYIPQVIWVHWSEDGNTQSMGIRILPSQILADYKQHEPRIAENLDVVRVEVQELAPPHMIKLVIPRDKSNCRSVKRYSR